jgi:Na+/melibiose symporter-like transporter
VGEHYSSSLNISLLSIGIIFLIVRLLDGFLDPVIGLLSDRKNYWLGHRKFWLLLSLPITVIAVWGLFAAESANENAFVLFILNIVLLTIGLSLFGPPYYSLGAELSMEYLERSRITFLREGFFLMGTISAALIYAISDGSTGGLKNIATAVIILYPTTIILTLIFVKENNTENNFDGGIGLFNLVKTITSERKIQKFLISQFFNAAANGIPGALFAFFVIHRLGREDLIGPLMLLYLISGVIAVPIWVYLGRFIPKTRLWCFSIMSSMFVFILVFFVGLESYILFGVICILTGFSVSADLALPASIQADLLDEDLKNTGRNRSGAFFSILSVINKTAAAISGAFVLIFLHFVKFDPLGNNNAEALFYLTCLYAIAPVTLKMLPLLIMWSFPEKASLRKAI